MRAMIFIPCLLAAACGNSPETRAPETDPAVADALADPIMADPGLALSQGAAGQVGVPLGGVPDVAKGLPTLGERARAATTGAFAGCNPKIAYGFSWSAKLPAALALPDGAKAVEAAGSDTPGCRLRLVRYGINQSATASLRHWQGRRGFRTSEKEGALEGTSGDVSFRAMATIVPGGATVDVVVAAK